MLTSCNVHFFFCRHFLMSASWLLCFSLYTPSLECRYLQPAIFLEGYMWSLQTYMDMSGILQTGLILLNLPLFCRCLETSSWMTRVTSINTTTLRLFSARWCFSSGGAGLIKSFNVNFVPLCGCQPCDCLCLNYQECHRRVLAGDYAVVSVRSGVWTRPLHRSPHLVSRPRGRLWHWLCLLLLCLIHLLKLISGQD